MEWDEINKFGVKNEDIVSSIIINNQRLKEIIFEMKPYIQLKYVYGFISEYFRSCIYTNSNLQHEYNHKTCTASQYNKNMLFISMCDRHYLTTLEIYIENLFKPMNVDISLVNELVYILNVIFDTYIQNNVYFKNSVVLLYITNGILVISSVGTICNFRYRELMHNSIINKPEFDLENRRIEI